MISSAYDMLMLTIGFICFAAPMLLVAIGELACIRDTRMGWHK
jgi:hypothetical protein